MKQANKFDGADDLYMTPKRIVKVSVKTSKGKAKETRSLFKKTPDNLKQAKEVNGGALPLKTPAPKPVKKATPVPKASAPKKATPKTKKTESVKRKGK